MSPSFIITLSSLVFLLLFSLSLFGFIVVRRLLIARRQVRFQRLYTKIEQDVLEAITHLNPDFTLKVARKHKDHPQVLTKVLLDFGDMILGEGKDHLGIIFNSALRDCCLKQLDSKKTSKRLQSVRLFVSFLDPSENGRLLRLLDDKPIIKLAAISALSRVPSIEMMRYIFRAFEEDAGAAVRSYFNIMFSLGDRIEPFVKARLKDSFPAEKLGLLVELVGAIPLRSLFDQIVPLAGHPDKEVRIRVARTLGKLLLPEAAGTLLALASDEAWEVQAQAVKSLGKLKDRSALDILTGALFSPFWYVRLNAGYGLAEMGEEGLRRLKRVAAQQVDRYAREMSVMVLNDSVNPAEAA
jgi:hypothetical protein